MSASESMGNIVPRNTANAAARKRRLLNRKALSLERADSNPSLLSRSFDLQAKRAKEKTRTNAMKTTKGGPMSERAKE